MPLLARTALPLLALLLPGPVTAQQPVVTATPASLRAAQTTSSPDEARLMRVMDRARRGERVVIGALGGSITRGAGASAPGRSYAAGVAGWWTRKFPGRVTFVNAGIGATGSGLGAFRLEQDLLNARPDLVLVEFAVNDIRVPSSPGTYEGVLRQLLNRGNHPAVLPIHFMVQSGDTQAPAFSEIARHYRLPQFDHAALITARDRAGLQKLPEMFVDAVHPSDAGHALAAWLITAYLDDVFARLPAPGRPLPPLVPVPAPLWTDAYEYPRCLSARNSQPVLKGAWKPGTLDQVCGVGWTARRAGDELTLSGLTGTAVGVLVHLYRDANHGVAEVWVDDGPRLKIDAYVPTSGGSYPGPYIRFFPVAEGLAPGPHTLHVRVLPDKNPEVRSNRDHTFELIHVLTAGAAPGPGKR